VRFVPMTGKASHETSPSNQPAFTPH